MSQQNNNVKDTRFKNNNLRYESVRGKHDKSDIYVVYKKNRAYPAYLIVFWFVVYLYN